MNSALPWSRANQLVSMRPGAPVLRCWECGAPQDVQADVVPIAVDAHGRVHLELLAVGGQRTVYLCPHCANEMGILRMGP